MVDLVLFTLGGDGFVFVCHQRWRLCSSSTSFIIDFGWYLIGIPSNEDFGDEPFLKSLVNNSMIAKTRQVDGVEIVFPEADTETDETEEKEDQNR